MSNTSDTGLVKDCLYIPDMEHYLTHWPFVEYHRDGSVTPIYVEVLRLRDTTRPFRLDPYPLIIREPTKMLFPMVRFLKEIADRYDFNELVLGKPPKMLILACIYMDNGYLLQKVLRAIVNINNAAYLLITLRSIFFHRSRAVGFGIIFNCIRDNAGIWPREVESLLQGQGNDQNLNTRHLFRVIRYGICRRESQGPILVSEFKCSFCKKVLSNSELYLDKKAIVNMKCCGSVAHRACYRSFRSQTIADSPLDWKVIDQSSLTGQRCPQCETFLSQCDCKFKVDDHEWCGHGSKWHNEVMEQYRDIGTCQCGFHVCQGVTRRSRVQWGVVRGMT